MGMNDHLGDLTHIEERIITCPNCKKKYRQVIEDQIAGFRCLDEDICPYCSAENGKSMSVEYHNYKIEEEQL